MGLGCNKHLSGSHGEPSIRGGPLVLCQHDAKVADLYTLTCPGPGGQGVILDKAAPLRREQCLERGSALSCQLGYTYVNLTQSGLSVLNSPSPREREDEPVPGVFAQPIHPSQDTISRILASPKGTSGHLERCWQGTPTPTPA